MTAMSAATVGFLAGWGYGLMAALRDHALAMRHGGRSKERIDSWSVLVFARPFGHQHLVFLDQEVIVRRSD